MFQYPPLPRAFQERHNTEVPWCFCIATVCRVPTYAFGSICSNAEKRSLLLRFHETGSVRANKIIITRPDSIFPHAVGFISTANIRQRSR